MKKHMPRPFSKGQSHQGPQLPGLPTQGVNVTAKMGRSDADKDGRSPAHKCMGGMKK